MFNKSDEKINHKRSKLEPPFQERRKRQTTFAVVAEGTELSTTSEINKIQTI